MSAHERVSSPQSGGDLDHVVRRERVLMLLAEAGYPDTEVLSKPSKRIEGATTLTISHPLPPVEVSWRAFMLAGSPLLPCLACFKHRRMFGGDCLSCMAHGDLVDDCGVER